MKNSTNNSTWNSNAGYTMIISPRSEIVNSQVTPFWSLEDLYTIYILEVYRLDKQSQKLRIKLMERNYEKV